MGAGSDKQGLSSLRLHGTGPMPCRFRTYSNVTYHAPCLLQAYKDSPVLGTSRFAAVRAFEQGLPPLPLPVPARAAKGSPQDTAAAATTTTAKRTANETDVGMDVIAVKRVCAGVGVGAGTGTNVFELN